MHVLTITVGHRWHCRAVVRHLYFVPNIAIFLTRCSYYASQVYTREFVPSSSTAPSHNLLSTSEKEHCAFDPHRMLSQLAV